MGDESVVLISPICRIIPELLAGKDRRGVNLLPDLLTIELGDEWEWQIMALDLTGT
jgi:hypothetical protein